MRLTIKELKKLAQHLDDNIEVEITLKTDHPSYSSDNKDNIFIPKCEG